MKKIAVIFLVVIITSCHELKSGKVVGKYSRPPYTTLHCHPIGKATICTPIHHPESFYVKIKGFYMDGRDSVWCVESFSVYESTYLNAKYGDFLTFQ